MNNKEKDTNPCDSIAYDCISVMKKNGQFRFIGTVRLVAALPCISPV